MIYRISALLCISLLFRAPLFAAEPEVVSVGREAGLLIELVNYSEQQFDLRISAPTAEKQDSLLQQAEVFVVENPARFVIDINGWRNRSQRKFQLKNPLLKALRFGTHRDKLRIVVDLKSSKLPEYVEKRSAGEVRLSFGSKKIAPVAENKITEEVAEKEAPPAEVREEPAVPEKPKAVAAAPEIKPAKKTVTQPEKKTAQPTPGEWREVAKDNPAAWIPLDSNSAAPNTWAFSLFNLSVGLLVASLFVLASMRYKRGAGRIPHSVAQIAMVEAGLINCYEVLGCTADHSDKEIKARYKELAKIYHADKLASQSLPNEVLELSAEQFRKIRDAYDTIRDVRGF